MHPEIRRVLETELSATRPPVPNSTAL
jgi:hypothetical protein